MSIAHEKDNQMVGLVFGYSTTSFRNMDFKVLTMFQEIKFIITIKSSFQQRIFYEQMNIVEINYNYLSMISKTYK